MMNYTRLIAVVFALGFLFFHQNLSAQFTSTPSLPTYTNTYNLGNLGYADDLKISCDISANDATFYVGKLDGSTLDAGTMQLGSDANGTWNYNLSQVSVSNGSGIISIPFDLCNLNSTDFPINFRVKYTNNSGGHKTVGTITITFSEWLIEEVTFFNTGISGSSSASVAMSWIPTQNPSSNEMFPTYKIYKSIGLAGTFSYVHTVENVTSSFYANWTDQNNIQENTEYCYRIYTCDECGNCTTNYATSCYTTPNLPLGVPSQVYNLEATTQSAASIELTWTKTSAATSYEIYQDGQLIGVTTGSPNFSQVVYNVNGLNSATQYCFQVKACNPDYCADLSAQDCASTESGPPSIVASVSSPTSITISWNAVPNASGYGIYNSNTGTSVAWTAVTSFTDHNLIQDQEYCYYVIAYVNGESTAPSNTSCATPDLSPHPSILVNPNNLDFGTQDIGSNTTLTFDINNVGTGLLSINAINLPTGYALVNQSLPFLISGGNTQTITVEFSPSSPILYNGDITVSSNSETGGNNIISVTGEGQFASNNSITLTAPQSGAIIASGANYNIQWNTGAGFSGNVKISYFNGNTTQILTSSTVNTGSYSWNVPTVGSPITNAKIIVESVNTSAISDDSGFFTIDVPGSTTCSFSDLNNTHFAHGAIIGLCALDIVTGDDNSSTVRPDDLINRAELAKVAYYGLGLNGTTPYATKFPSPFNDLQDSNLWYHDAAKTLSYLEYGDGISPFKRTRFDFFPSAEIERGYVLKVLVESFNLSIQNTSVPYSDVAGHEMEDYIKTAYYYGIIDNSYTQFQPDASALRGDVFIWLYNLLNSSNINVPNIQQSDYFIPINITPTNIAKGVGTSEGNFKAYGQTPFYIPGVQLPLAFSFSYNSYFTELPDEFFKLRPLGNAWTHSFNSYLMETNADSQYADDRIVIFMPGGTIHIYDKNTLEPVSHNVRNDLSKIGNIYTITTKSQITYTYEKLTGAYDEFPFVLKSIKDANNNEITLSYQTSLPSGNFRLHQVTGTAGRSLTFFYNGGGNTIRQVTDPIGRTVKFTYSNDNNFDVDLLTYEDALEQTTTFNYGTSNLESHLLKSITLPKGNTVTNTYEGRKLASTQNSAGNSMEIAIPTPSFTNPNDFYESTTSITTQGGSTIDYNTHFNQNGNVASQSGGGNSLTASYTDASQPMRPTDMTMNGTGISISYDSDGNVNQISYPNGSAESMIYDQWSNILSYTNGNGNTTQFSYNGAGQLISTQAPDGGTTSINRNAKGQVTSVSNPVGITQAFQYDNYGNVTKVSLPLGISTSAEYDGIGRTTKTISPTGKINSYEYDASDRLIQQINPLGAANGTTSYAYDANNNLTGITNAMNNTTTLAYEFDTDFLTSMSFGGASKGFEYHEDGRIKKYTKPDGQQLLYVYDLFRRLTDDGYATYSYNTDNLLQSVTNTTGTVQFTYNNMKRVSSTSFDGKTVGYQYDNVGNVTKLIYPDGKEVDYTYDVNNRLKTVKDWNNNTTTYNYRIDGKLTSSVLPNGITTTYTYDGLGRMTGSSAIGTTNVYTYNFTMDALGNHQSEEYDAPFITLNSFTAENTDYTYNPRNQIMSAGSTNFTHDANGNILQKGSTTFTWDIRDQLLGITDGTTTLAYTYDGLGHRRSRTENGTTTKYILDILGMSKVLAETDASGTEQHYYIYGLGLISRVKASNNTTRYYHYDYRGSTIAMTDENENITHSYFYDDFGEVLHASEEDFNNFRYLGLMGCIYETNDLVFMRARYLDVSTGRFLSEDPVWNTNLYTYASNNPLVIIDPMGTTDWHTVGQGAIMLIAGVASISVAVIAAPTVGVLAGVAVAFGVATGGISVAGGLGLTILGSVDADEEYVENFKDAIKTPIGAVGAGIGQIILDDPECGEFWGDILNGGIVNNLSPTGEVVEHIIASDDEIVDLLRVFKDSGELEENLDKISMFERCTGVKF